uniref:Girdin-like n=1 Tax=Globodera pallida TaxID=36090 RepID=A0A183CJ43_GLOPA
MGLMLSISSPSSASPPSSDGEEGTVRKYGSENAKAIDMGDEQQWNEGRKDRRQLGEAEEEIKSLESDRNFSTDQNERFGEEVIDQQQKISDHNGLTAEDQLKQIEELKSENEFLRNKCAGQEVVIDGLVGECAKKEKQIGEAEEMNKRLKNELDLTAFFDSGGTVPSSSSTPCTSTRLHSPIHGDAVVYVFDTVFFSSNKWKYSN